MEYTHLDYFNYYLKEFCNELIANFPDYEKGLVANYRELLESKQSHNDMYVKYFVSKVNDYMDKICNKDDSLFNQDNYVDKESGVVGSLMFLEGVDFLKLWHSSTNNDTNKQAIWKYLQLLVLLGRKVIPNNSEVMDILNNVGGHVYVPAKVEKTLRGAEDDLGDSGNKPDIFGLGGLSSMANLAGLGGLGGLGRLAGLGDLSGLGDLVGGSGDMPDLSSMVKTLGDALGGLDLKSMTDAFTNGMDTTCPDDNTETKGDLTDSCSQSTPDTPTTTSDTKTTTDMPIPNLGASTSNLFTDLAKEMASTFDFSNVEADTNNMGEAFSKFMSGDNPSKLMGLVSKFGSRLQKDISSGKVNHTDLLKDTTTMMSDLQKGNNLKKQAKKMANNPQVAQMAQQMRRQMGGGDTKARLQAKLAAKQQSE